MIPHPPKKQDERIRGWTRLIERLSHDLMTPLATIRLSAQSLKGILPDLVEGYQLALEHKLKEPPKDPKRFQFIQEQALIGVEAGVDKAIKRLMWTCEYMNKLMEIVPEDMERLSIKALVEKALAEYPFQKGERALVHVEIKKDFVFQAVPVFIEELLENLISNALSAIKQVNKGQIYIRTEVGKEWNTFYFKDTGAGMNKDRLADVFKRYFCLRNEEMRAGLGFCRHAILHAGGSMECESVEGEYTQFMVKFPALIRDPT